jgi:16S rRNA (cytosine1402-N4)-methyltransferase
MTESETDHRPVLLEAAVEALAIKSDGVYLDGTFGRGGHSRRILQQLGRDGRLIAMDRDPLAVAFAEKTLSRDERFSIVRTSFSMLDEVVDRIGVRGMLDGVLLDLGVSSPQLDQAERGFSFLQDGPLDMRMDPDVGQSAADWLAVADVGEIARVLKSYGEERYAKRIARAIVERRSERPILTTLDLAELISGANPAWEQGKHPATRCFQAIRIHINRELEELELALEKAVDLLAGGGRLAVISFHSLEDRMVKRFMRDQSKGDAYPPGLPVTQDQLNPRLKLVGKAVRADEVEVAANPRARSAVLRVAERVV